MSILLKIWTPDEVQLAKDPAKAFCSYVQQSVGVPHPTIKDVVLVRKKAKEFFANYPNTDWRTLCRIAAWCKARKIRLSRPWKIIDRFREAYVGGFLPELDNANRVDEDIETQIQTALQVESNEAWRRRLIMAQGVELRRMAISEWKKEQVTK